MMASLRSRLILGLVVVAAVGLLLLGGITYAEQRSFLQARVDQQALRAVPAVSRELDQRGFNVPGTHFTGPPLGGARAGPGPGPFGAVNLPTGTYGQRRDANGKVLGHVGPSRAYGQPALAAPKLPATVPVRQLITVGSVGDPGLRYRVLAVPSRDQPGTTIVAVPLREVDQTLHRLLLVEALVIGAVLVALGIVAWFLVRLGLRPLDRIGETAGAIAAGDLSRRVDPATPRTEVGRLGLALNAMLGRLEQAFAEREASEQRLRQFLSDASHELRTPLASIRGYAELFRIGAARKPADTAKAMTRIEQEAARMGVLVEDLLMLARLDELREPVREEVDLADVARDAVEDTRATAPDRTIALSAGPGARVLGDPHQLRQVLSNLLRNAVVHTPAGTPVEVGVARAGDDVRVDVRDHGPGLPTSEPDALFERFWRAEGGRERGRGGAGLGLAIVAGIVHAHGGEVQAADAPDGGACFSVRLPAHEPRPRSGVSQPALTSH
jgi:two-component system, OmpR family, sensor kinase